MRQMKGVGFTFPPITPPTKSNAIASSTSSSAINERRVVLSLLIILYQLMQSTSPSNTGCHIFLFL